MNAPRHLARLGLAATAIAAAAALLWSPSGATASIVHFEGHASGLRPDSDMRIAFDVRTGQGRPKTMSNVTVSGLDYHCEFGGDTERDVRFLGSARFDSRGSFDIAEHAPPPEWKNDLYGRFRYPKKGVRRKPRISGWIQSEFGYGPTRDSYNCLASEEFIAVPKR